MSKTSNVFWLTAILIVGLALFAQHTSNSAVVSGRVFDAEAHPVAGARISIFPSGAFSGGLPYAATDQNGAYKLVSPPFGDAWITAVKEEAGYPDTNGLLFAEETDTRPKVFLSPGSRTMLDIHLGPPDGVLELVVLDKQTKTPISGAKLSLHRDTPEAIYSATLPQGKTILALPSVPIEVSVSASGYLPWKFEQSGGKLVLPHGQRLSLKVELDAKQ